MAKKSEEKKGEYGRIVEDVVSRLKSGEERNAAMHILSSQKAAETYDILRENEIPYSTAKKIIAHSLRNFQKGRGLTIGSYASGIAEELSNTERYADVVHEMYKEGIIGQKQYQEIQGSVVEHIKGRSKQLRKGLSQLEKITGVAASIFGIFGIGLLIASGMKITGNVVGNSAGNLSGSLAGFVLLAVSLFLFWRSFKN